MNVSGTYFNKWRSIDYPVPLLHRAFSPAFITATVLMVAALSVTLTSCCGTAEEVQYVDAADAGAVPGGSGGTGGPVVPDAPTVPSAGGEPLTGVETLPPADDGPDLGALDRYAIIIVVLAVVASMAVYMPRAVQMTRIDIAQRESMAARLALARGDFAGALAGFDRAIDEAQLAYTRKRRVDRPAEWTMLPDAFYISLWRGRAAALRGLGRVKSALATNRLADELEAVVGNGAGHR